MVWVRPAKPEEYELSPPRGFLSPSDFVEHYGPLPEGVLQWDAPSALTEALGVVPGVIRSTNTLYAQTVMTRGTLRVEVSPCVGLEDVCETNLTDDNTMPVPFQVVVQATMATLSLGFGTQYLFDWRRFKKMLNDRLRVSFRVFLTAKSKTIVEEWYNRGKTRRKIIVEHVMTPLEVALVRYIHDIGGPRLIIPPSFRNQYYANQSNKLRLLVDPFWSAHENIGGQDDRTTE